MSTTTTTATVTVKKDDVATGDGEVKKDDVVAAPAPVVKEEDLGPYVVSLVGNHTAKEKKAIEKNFKNVERNLNLRIHNKTTDVPIKIIKVHYWYGLANDEKGTGRWVELTQEEKDALKKIEDEKKEEAKKDDAAPKEEVKKDDAPKEDGGDGGDGAPKDDGGDGAPKDDGGKAKDDGAKAKEDAGDGDAAPKEKAKDDGAAEKPKEDAGDGDGAAAKEKAKEDGGDGDGDAAPKEKAKEDGGDGEKKEEEAAKEKEEAKPVVVDADERQEPNPGKEVPSSFLNAIIKPHSIGRILLRLDPQAKESDTPCVSFCFIGEVKAPEVGTKGSASWKPGFKKRWAGEIVKVNGDDTYDFKFDKGQDTRLAVPRREIDGIDAGLISFYGSVGYTRINQFGCDNGDKHPKKIENWENAKGLAKDNPITTKVWEPRAEDFTVIYNMDKKQKATCEVHFQRKAVVVVPKEEEPKVDGEAAKKDDGAAEKGKDDKGAGGDD